MILPPTKYKDVDNKTKQTITENKVIVQQNE